VVLLWFFFSMQRHKSVFFPSLFLFLIALPPVFVFVSFLSSLCILFLLSLFFSLSFLSFWSPLSFHRPLFPSLYSVLFLSFVLQLFFSSLWLSLSSPFKCSLFCFLVSFFFKIFLSLQNSILCSPFCFSVSSSKISPTSFPFFFFCFSPLYSLFFFSRP